MSYKLEDYLRDNYGECQCKMGHLCYGGRCPHWKSWGCKTYEELAHQQEIKHGEANRGTGQPES